MPTPKLTRGTAIAIEARVIAGDTNRQITKKLGVSMGTVSNIRQGIVSKEADLARAKKKELAASSQYQDAQKEILRLNDELKMFTATADATRHYRPTKIEPKHGGKGEATAVINLSDWHYEEEVNLAAVNGVNEYNPKIAHRRITEVLQSAAGIIDMCKTKSKIDTLIINLLGDMINGWLRDESLATNAMTPTKATLEVFDELCSGIEFLRKETKVKEIIIPCVCGNHGRITQKKWSKLGAETNFDWMIYQLLARWFEAKHIKNVKFLLPQGDMVYYTVYGRVIRVSHGDNIRYQGGIGGVHVPLRKAIDGWNTYKHADYNYFGHWHSDTTGEDYRMNGSVIGFNEFAIRIKARYQKPSQAFELQHPKYGATGRFPIFVD